jgi:hypothetical protein
MIVAVDDSFDRQQEIAKPTKLWAEHFKSAGQIHINSHLTSEFFFKSQRRHFGAKAFLGLSDGWLAAACSLFGLALWCLTDCGVVQHAACQAQSESCPRNPRIPVDQPVQKN